MYIHSYITTTKRSPIVNYYYIIVSIIQEEEDIMICTTYLLVLIKSLTPPPNRHNLHLEIQFPYPPRLYHSACDDLVRPHMASHITQHDVEREPGPIIDPGETLFPFVVLPYLGRRRGGVVGGEGWLGTFQGRRMIGIRGEGGSCQNFDSDVLKHGITLVLTIIACVHNKK